MAHTAAGGVAGGPALARPGVWRVAVGPQGAAIEERIGERVDDLFAGAAEQPGRNGGRGNTHQEHMIQAEAVERVLEGEDALDFMRLDHGQQHIAHRQRRLARGVRPPAEVSGDREDGAEVIRRMPPLGREPSVVEVEPADHRTDVEGRLDGLEFVGRAGHARAAPRQLGARDRRP